MKVYLFFYPFLVIWKRKIFPIKSAVWRLFSPWFVLTCRNIWFPTTMWGICDWIWTASLASCNQQEIDCQIFFFHDRDLTTKRTGEFQSNLLLTATSSTLPGQTLLDKRWHSARLPAFAPNEHRRAWSYGMNAGRPALRWPDLSSLLDRERHHIIPVFLRVFKKSLSQKFVFSNFLQTN